MGRLSVAEGQMYFTCESLKFYFCATSPWSTLFSKMHPW